MNNYQLSINNYQLPKGYKQTEVGVIPEGWDVKRVKDVATLQRGYDLPRRLRRDGEIPVVTSTGVTDTHSEAREKAPGVVTGRYGTIGEIFFIEEDYWPHNTTLFVKDFHGNSPLFTYYFLRTIDFQSHSGKSGVPGVNRNDLHALNIALPPLSEQRAIATTLSDVDALLESLDRLIAKKRDLKQATMQQLLTGKTRLPGFGEGKGYKETEVGVIPEDWDVKQLAEIATNFLNGGTPSTQKAEYWSGNIPWITGADVVNQEVVEVRRFITPEAIKNSPTNLIEQGNLLIVTRTGVGKLAVAPFDVAISQDLTGVYLDTKKALTEFLFRYLNYHSDILKSLNQGTSIAGITRDVLISAKVVLPFLEEQTAIATILSDMDAEIAALEQRRDKTRALKQGMMQQLLTGKVRLLD